MRYLARTTNPEANLGTGGPPSGITAAVENPQFSFVAPVLSVLVQIKGTPVLRVAERFAVYGGKPIGDEFKPRYYSEECAKVD